MKNNYICGIKEEPCKLCKKMFLHTTEHIYKLTVNSRVLNFCSWTCYRKYQKMIANKCEYKVKKKYCY